MGGLLGKPPLFPVSDDNLINGQTNLNCSTSICTEGDGYAKFKLTTGKTHRLRLINAGGQASQKFSIDNHEMTVIANDYVPIQPYTTNVISLGVGQRSDVLVTAMGNADDSVWMRAVIDSSCFPNTTRQDTALAAIYYPEADTTERPTTNGTGFAPGFCTNVSCLQSLFLQQASIIDQRPGSSFPNSTSLPHQASCYPSCNADVRYRRCDQQNRLRHVFRQQLEFPRRLQVSFPHLPTKQNIPTHSSLSNPLLLLAAEGNTSYPNHPDWNVYDFAQNTSIRAIIRNYFPLVHPMHLHGHVFWVLAEGLGEWNGAVTNPSNPQRRDTQLMAAGSADIPSYIVIQWNADNPGIWPLHCHSFGHASTGLLVNILVSPRRPCIHDDDDDDKS